MPSQGLKTPRRGGTVVLTAEDEDDVFDIAVVPRKSDERASSRPSKTKSKRKSKKRYEAVVELAPPADDDGGQDSGQESDVEQPHPTRARAGGRGDKKPKKARARAAASDDDGDDAHDDDDDDADHDTGTEHEANLGSSSTAPRHTGLASFARLSSRRLAAAVIIACALLILFLWPERGLFGDRAAAAVRGTALNVLLTSPPPASPPGIPAPSPPPPSPPPPTTPPPLPPPQHPPSPPPPSPPFPPPSPPAPPGLPPRDPPAGCLRQDMDSLHELKPPETCGSDPSRNSDASVCEGAYAWSGMPANSAVRCVWRAGRHDHRCNDALCRDINDDCCTVPGEERYCTSDPNDPNVTYSIEERGVGWFYFDSRRLRCPNLYACCTGEESAAGCYPDDETLIPCHPLPPPAPPAMPPPPSPAMPPSVPPWDYMTPERCEMMWADPTSRFHQLWSDTGWRTLVPGQTEPCWHADGRGFFDTAWDGAFCGTRNWYTGNEGQLGDAHSLGPADPSVSHRFTTGAPALLGFDESIDSYCQSNGGKNPGGPSGHAISCIRANVNSTSTPRHMIPSPLTP